MLFVSAVLIAWVFLLSAPDYIRDVNHNVANMWYFNGLSSVARTEHQTIDSTYAKFCDNRKEIPGYYSKNLADWYIFAIPLAQTWITFCRPFLGTDVHAAVIASSVIGLLVVFVTFMVGIKFFNRTTAFFSSVMLSTSLVFLLTIRNGYVFYAFDSMLGIATVSLFALAHAGKKRSILIACAFSMAVGLFNGYSMFFVFIPVSLALIVLIQRYFLKNYSFSLKEYLVFLAVASGLFLVFTVLYSLSVNAPLARTAGKIAFFFSWRSGSISSGQSALMSHLVNIKRAAVILFDRSYLPPSIYASSDNVSAYGHPVFPALIALLVLFGAVKTVWKRNAAALSIAVPAAVCITFILFLLPFDTRYMMVALPCFYILAGYGLSELFCFIRENTGRVTKSVALSGLALILLVTVLGECRYFGEDYGAHSGYLGRFYGQVQAGRYVGLNYDPKDTFVVLNDPDSTPEDIFCYAAMPKIFNYCFWSDRASERNWQDRVFEKYTRIVYIFHNGSSFTEVPGARNCIPSDWEPFTYDNPTAEPVCMINDHSGIPVISVYALKKCDILASSYTFNGNTSRLGAIRIDSQMNDAFRPADSAYGKLKHYSKSLIFKSNKECVVRFCPIYYDKSFAKEASSVRNLHLPADDPRFLELDKGGEGEIKYAISAPFPAREITVQLHPRIFNDKQRKNLFKCLYSLDDKTYNELFKLRSDGSEAWTAHFNKDSYNQLRAISNTIYIKCMFEGSPGSVQLWSPFPVGKGKINMTQFEVKASSPALSDIVIAKDPALKDLLLQGKGRLVRYYYLK